MSTPASTGRRRNTPPAPVPAAPALNYTDWVEPRGTFLGEYARKNGDFDSFASFRGTLVIVWTSRKKKDGSGGNQIARVQSNTDDKALHNLPAGLFTQFAENNPGQNLVLFEEGTDRWTINPEVVWSYDVETGISL